MKPARDAYRVAAEETHEVPRALLPGSNYQRPGQVEPLGNTNHAYLEGEEIALCGVVVVTMWRFVRPFAKLTSATRCPGCRARFDALPSGPSKWDRSGDHRG